jgi:hypothetical protein
MRQALNVSLFNLSKVRSHAADGGSLGEDATIKAHLLLIDK